jgi:hypothetical protein
VNEPFPEFFARARTIRVRDPLAEFLGAAQGGVIEYSYLDAVKLAGHSCPTVAAAWLAVREALARLYPGELPERGGVRVELRGALDEGTTGVVGNVASLVTGAAGEGGFKGIAGRFERRGLLVYGAPIGADLRFTRCDNGRSAELDLPQAPPASAQLRAGLHRALAPDPSLDELRGFAQAWQARVAAFLTEGEAQA